MSHNNVVAHNEIYSGHYVPESREFLAGYESKWTNLVAQQCGVLERGLLYRTRRAISSSDPVALSHLDDLLALGERLVSAHEDAAPQSVKNELRHALIVKEAELESHFQSA